MNIHHVNLDISNIKSNSYHHMSISIMFVTSSGTLSIIIDSDSNITNSDITYPDIKNSHIADS